MRPKLLIAVGVIVASAFVAGCSTRAAGSERLSARNPLAPTQATAAPDTTPVHNPPPHPPSPPQNLSLQFVSADSVAAGQSSDTRWLFGNSGHSSLAVTWVMTNGHGWAGFPKQGSLTLAPLSTQRLTVAVAVPDTSQSAQCPLHMSATPQHGTPVAADGAIQVIN